MTAPEPAPEPAPLDQQLCFSLYATSMAITRIYKPMLDKLGITYPQFLVLQALAEEQDGRPVGAIAERLALEPSTITPLTKRLEAAGLVSRMRDPEDERQVRVRLTDLGRERWAETGCLAPMILERAGMPVERLSNLHAEVKALREALAAPPAG